jgi:transposase-like protein
MFTHVAARTVRCSPEGSFSRSASDHSSPPDPPRVLPAGARVCRPGFPPGRTVHLDQGTHNNIVEQDHRRIKRLVRPGLGFGGFRTAWRTLIGYEAMAMIRKGQVHNIGGRDIRAQAALVAELFGVAA